MPLSDQQRVSLESEDDGLPRTAKASEPKLLGRPNKVVGSGSGLTSRWSPSLRRDKKTDTPVLCLNPGGTESRSERWLPNTDQGNYERVTIPLGSGQRTVEVWISSTDLTDLDNLVLRNCVILMWS